MNKSSLCFLDRFRLNNGDKNLIVFFHNMALQNTERAAALINNEALHYGTLFTLRYEIENSNLCNYMNSKNKFALVFTQEILKNENKVLRLHFCFSDYIQICYISLKWMLESGECDDGLSNEYDKIMDIAAALLINTYNDKTVLPAAARIIFKRHRKGFLIHDLIWTFFQCRDPFCLILIAEYLNSSDSKDADLAKKLLAFNFSKEEDNRLDKEQQYTLFIDWIRENSSYIYFSGDNFQQSPDPKPYVLVPGAKYLCSAVSPQTGELLKQLSEKEKKLLAEFNNLDYNLQLLMSDYSLKLFHRDKEKWSSWLSLTVEEQLKYAKAGGI